MNALQFCGDIWLPKGTKPTLPTWFTQGLVFNLEGPVTKLDKAEVGKICLKTDPEALSCAFAHGRPAAACLANNHSLDFGLEGLQDTWRYLDKLGVPYFGAGTKADNCNNPLVLRIDETPVALIGYVCPSTHPIFVSEDGPGVAPISIEQIHLDVEKSRQLGAARIVVSLHWGDEEVSLPKGEDILTANEILQLGVDLIVGHHTHCQQPVFVSGQQAVFFGLGNALFPDLNLGVGGKVTAWTKQRSWNRRATLVRYAPQCGAIHWHVIEQNPETLEVTRCKHLPLDVWGTLPDVVLSHKYARKFALAVRWSWLRLAVSRFLARPKFPSLGTLRYVFRTIIGGK